MCLLSNVKVAAYNTLICVSQTIAGFTCTFTVLEPEFIIHPTDVYAAAPYSATFTCKAKGFGNLSIKWKREGSLALPNQSEQTVHFPEVTKSYITSTITIYHVTDQDAGKYYCTASNELEESNSTAANLYYPGKPL